MSKTSQQQTTDEIAKAKVQLHLRLTYEDWKETFKQLRTRSEIGVFYAIRTLDPFGDRALDIDCTVLGDELGLHRTTVSDALKLLSEKKLIDLEITKARVKQKISNRRLTLLTLEENGSNQEKKEEKTMRAAALSDESPASQASPQPHSGGAALTDERPRTEQPPEPLPQADSEIPQTIQTSSDLNHTLSDSSERENESFEKFCRRKIDELPQRPNNPKAYIRKYREDYLAEWQEEETRRKANEAALEASKPKTDEQPKTAEQLNKSWRSANLIKAATALKAIEAEARELGYEVTEEGIFDAKSNSSSGVDFPPPGTGFNPKRE